MNFKVFFFNIFFNQRMTKLKNNFSSNISTTHREGSLYTEDHTPQSPPEIYGGFEDKIKNSNSSSRLCNDRENRLNVTFNSTTINTFPIVKTIVCHLNSVHLVLHALDQRLSILEDRNN